MSVILFQEVPIREGEPVIYLAVHAVKWRPEWGDPTIAFNAVEVPDLAIGLVGQLAESSLADLQEIVDKGDPADLRKAADKLDAWAIKLARVSAYVSRRVYENGDHKSAVKHQNWVAAEVRKALGFIQGIYPLRF